MVIGVTGTKGKTTVVELLHAVLAGAGYSVASASSLRFKINNEETRNETKMTMPGRFFAQKFLREALKKNCRYAVLEVTSEGVKQFRHRFIRFRMAVMTNVAPEHLESHGSFENYLRSKLDLFWRLGQEGAAIINADDEKGIRFSAATGARKIFYGHDFIKTDNKVFAIKERDVSYNGTRFHIDSHEIISPLLGEFNFYNILAVLGASIGLNIPLDTAGQAIAKISGIPGRLEYIQKKPFAVVVDYAHTPDSLRSVYGLLKSSSEARMICVLGAAGGGRDSWKRPKFGEISEEFCSIIIVTNEDPYDEDPEEIMEEITRGWSKKELGEKIADRRLAIACALRRARSGDIVVITGKGAEPWIIGKNGTKTSWDDRQVVLEELRKLEK